MALPTQQEYTNKRDTFNPRVLVVGTCGWLLGDYGISS